MTGTGQPSVPIAVRPAEPADAAALAHACGDGMDNEEGEADIPCRPPDTSTGEPA